MRSRASKWVVRVTGVVVFLWILVCAGSIYAARQAALAGGAEIETASESVPGGDFEALAVRAEAAALHFRSAEDSLGRPWLRPLRWVPVVGTQLRASERLVQGAGVTARSGAVALREIDRLSFAPTDRPASIRELGSIAQSFHTTVAPIDIGSAEGLLPPIRDARERFQSKLNRLGGLSDASAVADELAAVLEGPRTYLLIASNPAEGRPLSGTPLFAAEVHFAKGDVTMSPWEQPVTVQPEGSVEIHDADLATNWAWANGDRAIQYLGTSPRLSASAEIAADLWEVSKGTQIDGVLIVSSLALEPIMSAVGPSTIGSRTFGADEIVRYLMVEQYSEFSLQDQLLRKDRLKEIAEDVFNKLRRAESPLALGKAMADASSRRHLMAWSRQPSDQSLWRRLGLDGELPDDAMHIGLVNTGANKLDSYMRLTAKVSSLPTGVNSRDVALTIEVTNTSTGQEGDYATGTAVRELGLPRGTYFGIFQAAIPGAAKDVSIDGTNRFAVYGSDGPTRVVGQFLYLPPRHRMSITVRFTLSQGESLTVVPSARYPAVVWSTPSAVWSDWDGGRSLMLTALDQNPSSFEAWHPVSDLASTLAAPPGREAEQQRLVLAAELSALDTQLGPLAALPLINDIVPERDLGITPSIGDVVSGTAFNAQLGRLLVEKQVLTRRLADAGSERAR